MNNDVRTRFAPSPTGHMHIGNLRTALFEYLVAKSQDGKFILRIEDTDRERFVNDAEQIIYETLNSVGIICDEGPHIGGEYGPYKQSERKNSYLKYAQELISKNKAYYCFCEKSENDSTFQDSGYYDKCRDLTENEINKLISDKTNFVIRQKMPKDGKTVFEDIVFGKIEVENKELEDQILIKSDGYPTYNFANVIDDHEMKISHIVRGNEYLSSTPKYNLLYEAFGWEIPKYIHLPLIMGKNEDGSTSKLSKRHGAVGFNDLIDMGYIPEAIINYIAFLGWCPDNNKEIFSIKDLEKEFSIERISKSPSIFDYKKLDWFNSQYLSMKSNEEFFKLSFPYIKNVIKKETVNTIKIAELLKTRISRLDEISELIDFIQNLNNYDINLFINKKSKSTLESSLNILEKLSESLKDITSWTHENLHDYIINFAKKNDLKNSIVLWPLRISISGKAVTPGGAVEILEILGKEESLTRLNFGIQKLNDELK